MDRDCIFDANLMLELHPDKDTIRLNDFNLKRVSIPDDLSIETRCLGDDPLTCISDWAAQLTSESMKRGFQSKIYTGLNEAIRNAYQHGNNGNPRKEISVGTKFEENRATYIVCDQGKTIRSDFMSYVAAQRMWQRRGRPLNFYEFTKSISPRGNLGVGLSFIHNYFSSVTYFHSDLGGLGVQLTTEKQSSVMQ